jgi:DNA modification methylase
VYRALLEQYSKPEQIVTHVFSGSGNGGIAAVLLNRKAILIVLHYHREVVKRLRRKCPGEKQTTEFEF